MQNDFAVPFAIALLVTLILIIGQCTRERLDSEKANKICAPYQHVFFFTTEDGKEFAVCKTNEGLKLVPK